MKVTKTISIGDKEITLRTSAAIPRIYRLFFKQDLFHDFIEISDNKNNQGKMISASLPVIEQLVFAMAYHHDPKKTGSDIIEFLSRYDTSSLIAIAEDVVKFWSENALPQVEVKKNQNQPAEN